MKESELQEWLDDNLNDLPSLIENLEILQKANETPEEPCRTGDSWLNTMQSVNWAANRVLAERFEDALSLLAEDGELISLGTEFPLLEHSGRGRAPSADILAIFQELAAYAIVEVKVLRQTEREGVTELSAYARGLEDKYLGLSAHDCVWLLVSTEWRSTLISAVAHQVVFSGQCIVPLKARVDFDGGRINSVALSVVDLRGKVERTSTDSLVWSGAYEMICVYTSNAPPSPEIFQYVVSTDYERLDTSGFSFFHAGAEHRAGRLPMPYGFVVCVFNPFAAYLKRRQLDHFVEKGVALDSDDYRCLFRTNPENYIDVDLRPGWNIIEVPQENDGEHSTLCKAEEGCDSFSCGAYSLYELSIRTLRSGYMAFRKMLKRLRLFDYGQMEISEPNFHGALLNRDGINPSHYEVSDMESVRYFGFLHDVMIRIARIGSDASSPLERYSDAKLIMQILETANGSDQS